MHEPQLLRLQRGGDAADDDGPSEAAAAGDHPHLRGAAGDLPHGGGWERGGVRGDRPPPRYAHGYQLLPFQLGFERLTPASLW